MLLTTESQVQAKPEGKLNASPRKKVTFDVNVKTYEPEQVYDFQPEKSEEERTLVEKLSQSRSEESSVTSVESYPTNHRYHNCSCTGENEEDGAMEYWDSDLTDEEEDDGDSDMGEEYEEVGEDFEDGIVYLRSRNGANNQGVFEELESSIHVYDKDVKSMGLNRNVRDRSVYVHPVLNPVENLSQWKAVKAKRTPPLVSQKENLVLNQAAFGAESPKKLNKEIAVDASLSNWLASSETSPVNEGLYDVGTPDRSSSKGSNSVISYEDRPILGALTDEELKKFSASSPRKSPRDEIMPIIGSVGSYWNCGGYAEDSGSANRVNSRRVHLE